MRKDTDVIHLRLTGAQVTRIKELLDNYYTVELVDVEDDHECDSDCAEDCSREVDVHQELAPPPKPTHLGIEYLVEQILELL